MAEAQNIVVQVVKANQMEFFNRLKPGLQQNAFSGSSSASASNSQLVFGGGLYFDIFAFLALFNRAVSLLSVCCSHKRVICLLAMESPKTNNFV